MEIVIFGAGGQAKVVYEIVRSVGNFTPIAFVSDQNLETYLGLPHVKLTSFLSLKCKNGIVAIGDNWKRKAVVEFILDKDPDFIFVSLVHPSAVVADGVLVNPGSVIMANATINVGSQVGRHCIVNTNSSIDHDCKLGNFASVAPGAILGGNVIVGDFSAISIAACIIHGKKIGSHSVVGAQSLVLKDIGDRVVAYGSPCRIVRPRSEGEKYL